MSEYTSVVVLGGGYAGVMAANRLTQRDDVTVTLINPRPHFVERIRLHQLVGDPTTRSSITTRSSPPGSRRWSTPRQRLIRTRAR